LSSDILVEHDVAFKMRDGVTLYADVYRHRIPMSPSRQLSAGRHSERSSMVSCP
jgi:predicted acyl esterase